MRRKISLMASLLAGMLLASCASGPQLYSDWDDSVDFSAYRTFSFFNPMSIEGEGYATFHGNAFRNAIRSEMISRGYQEVEEGGDLGINVSARLEERTNVSTTTDPMAYGGYYHYRRGFYDPWMSYNFNTTTHVSQYTEGTINIDLVDMKQKRLVWEGVGVGKVRPDRSNAERRTAINNGVAALFDDYPFTAGQ